MGTRTSHRSRTFRTGLAAAAAGILLAVTGVTVSPASAGGHGQGQGVGGPAESGSVTICHRSNAVENPYRTMTVSFDASNGALQGPDHTGHAGPLFDYEADPSDSDYPYAPPMDGDEWGDIIPPYEWDGGSYPGSQAWLEGGADLLAADCNGGEDVDDADLCDDGTEPGEDGLCDEDPVDACPDDDGFQAEGPCEEQDVDVCPEEGVQTEGPCENDQIVDLCEDVPGTQTGLPCPVDVCPDVPDFQATDDACPPELIPPLVLENLPPQAQAPEVVPTAPRRPVQVAGIQVLPATAAAQELPRTGVDTGTLVQLGLGLVLAGAGVMVAARRPEGATAH